MQVGQLQFLLMGIMFLVNTAVGLAPILLKGNISKRLVPRAHVRSRLLSCASCFGAGVFLFVCFMGLLPDADEKFHHFLEKLGHTNEKWESFAEFPWAFFVVTSGFLIIFTIDKLVHAMEHSRSVSKSIKAHSLLQQTSVEGAKESDNEAGGKVANGHVSEFDPCEDHEGGHGVPSSVIFLIALGIHSVFEGMAVGLQTQKEKVMELFVAVLVHEMVMAFTFGMEVSKSNTLSRCYKVIYVLIFTATIPLGVAVGYALQNAPSEHREIVSAVFEAFATGIFIHVIFIEVLAHEFPGHHHHHSHHQQKQQKQTEGGALQSDTKNVVSYYQRSETLVILEKVGCICCGLLTLILLSVFMHDHH